MLRKLMLVLLLVSASSLCAAENASEILEKTGCRNGILVVLGDLKCRLAIDLAKASHSTIYVQLIDPGDVRVARKLVDAAGLCGRKIYVEQGDRSRIHLADDVADAVVVLEPATDIKEAEVLRVLNPLGKALLDGKVLREPFPEGIDDWSHPLHLPDNNPRSVDRVAVEPYRTQFLATPFYAPMPQATVASAGRAFKVFGGVVRHPQEKPWQNRLVAFNGYNGGILWNRPLPDGFLFNLNTLVATPRALYICAGPTCDVLDTATGEVKDRIVVGGEVGKGKAWKWLAMEGGVLYGVLGAPGKKVRVREWQSFRGGWEGHGRTGTLTDETGAAGGSTIVCAIDASTKEILWTHQEEQPFNARATCMKNGRIFLLRWGDYLTCVDGRNGKELWRKTGGSDPELIQIFARDKKLMNLFKNGKPPYLGGGEHLLCNNDTVFFANTLGSLVALSADTGRIRWQSRGLFEGKDPFEDKKVTVARYVRSYVRLLLRDDSLYALGRGRAHRYDLSTGKVLSRMRLGGNCAILTGAPEGIVWRASGVTYCVDWTSGNVKYVLPMRPTCADGVTVANGLLYWWPMVCQCSSLSGVGCLGSAREEEVKAAASAELILERATASDAPVAALPDSNHDWPTWRGNSARTAKTEAVVPEKVERLWDWRPRSPSQLTAPVAAGGLVFAGGLDGAVRCVDANTGELRWKAWTGGEMRYPPSIWKGRVLAGSGDGWVYCFEAATGRQLWRLRVAPEERKIPVYGALLSTWPVASGVLIEGGVGYAAAGITGLDGTVVCAFDAADGTPKWRYHHAFNYKPVQGAPSFIGVQGALLLHRGDLFLPGADGLAILDAASGRLKSYDTTWVRRRIRRGSELRLVGDDVLHTGPYLYERPDIPSFLAARAFPFALTGYSSGPVFWYKVRGNDDALCALAQMPDWKWDQITHHRDHAKVLKATFEPARWRFKCPGAAAVVGAPNAILAAIGRPLDRRRPGVDPGGYKIAALNPADGSVLWQQPLPAEPVRWGLAVDSRGRIIVTLRDGRVICFGERQD